MAINGRQLGLGILEENSDQQFSVKEVEFGSDGEKSVWWNKKFFM